MHAEKNTTKQTPLPHHSLQPFCDICGGMGTVHSGGGGHCGLLDRSCHRGRWWYFGAWVGEACGLACAASPPNLQHYVWSPGSWALWTPTHEWAGRMGRGVAVELTIALRCSPLLPAWACRAAPSLPSLPSSLLFPCPSGSDSWGPSGLDRSALLPRSEQPHPLLTPNIATQLL